MTQSGENIESILSYLQQFTPFDAFPVVSESHSIHPFAADVKNVPLTALRNLSRVSGSLKNCLVAYNDATVSDPKLVSLLRQCTALITNLHTVSYASIISYFRALVSDYFSFFMFF